MFFAVLYHVVKNTNNIIQILGQNWLKNMCVFCFRFCNGGTCLTTTTKGLHIVTFWLVISEFNVYSQNMYCTTDTCTKIAWSMWMLAILRRSSFHWKLPVCNCLEAVNRQGGLCRLPHAMFGLRNFVSFYLVKAITICHCVRPCRFFFWRSADWMTSHVHI